MSFKFIQDFPDDDLWEVFLKASQSAQNFYVDNVITINVDIVENLKEYLIGAGRIRFIHKNVKKTTLKILKGNLCFPLALSVA